MLPQKYIEEKAIKTMRREGAAPLNIMCIILKPMKTRFRRFENDVLTVIKLVATVSSPLIGFPSRYNLFVCEAVLPMVTGILQSHEVRKESSRTQHRLL